MTHRQIAGVATAVVIGIVHGTLLAFGDAVRKALNS
jgi:hypothetical protein